MKTIKVYMSAFLLVSCVLTSMSTHAMNSNNSDVINSIFVNQYISASVLFGVLLGSYLCYKHFFNNKETIIKPGVDQKSLRLDNSQKQVMSEPFNVANQLTNQIVKVVNSQDQSLNISVSNINDERLQQFTVPSYSYEEIDIS